MLGDRSIRYCKCIYSYVFLCIYNLILSTLNPEIIWAIAFLWKCLRVQLIIKNMCAGGHLRGSELVKYVTLDFSLGLDLRVVSSSLLWGLRWVQRLLLKKYVSHTPLYVTEWISRFHRCQISLCLKITV